MDTYCRLLWAVVYRVAQEVSQYLRNPVCIPLSGAIPFLMEINLALWMSDTEFSKNPLDDFAQIRCTPLHGYIPDT